jgi:hypothetical protein
MTGMRRWPLFLIAAPAAVAVWSGWVGLGSMCGFGVVAPLPGILPGFHIDTAITLPVGVEAYGTYALGAWLTPGMPVRARVFARRSAIGALVLGMSGQVIYHLLAAAHAARAPWPVVVLVSCLPVVTLGFGAALTHLLRADPDGASAVIPEALEAAGVAPVALSVAPDDTLPDAADDATVSGQPDISAATARQKRRTQADIEAEALAVLSRQPGISGAELGRSVGVSGRTGQRLLTRLTNARETASTEDAAP